MHNHSHTESHLSEINQTPAGAEARNNAWRSDTFITGLLRSWKAFYITWGDFKMCCEGCCRTLLSDPSEFEWTQQSVPAEALSNRHSRTLCETVRLKIPCGTNCQVNAQLFDLQGAYKAAAKGITLYWLINAFSLSVPLAICQTSAHHLGYKYDLLSYCLPFGLHGLESPAEFMTKIKLLTLQFPKCSDFADQGY